MAGLVPAIHAAARVGRPLTYGDARSRCLASSRRFGDRRGADHWTAGQLGRDAWGTWL